MSSHWWKLLSCLLAFLAAVPLADAKFGISQDMGDFMMPPSALLLWTPGRKCGRT